MYLAGYIGIRAYLTVHFHQAIILTIRPVMLYWARSILDGDTLDGTRAVKSSYGPLVRTCTEAARRLLEVLLDLRHRDHLGIHDPWPIHVIHLTNF